MSKRMFVVTYDDGEGSGFPRSEWRTLAYDEDHARERFEDDPSAEGFRVLSVRREKPLRAKGVR